MTDSGFRAAMDRLRREHPGCSLVAFADLEARLVLSVSAETRPGQERLDRLCAEAARLLARLPTGLPGGGIPARAMVLDAGELRLFLRSPEEPGEALLIAASGSADALALGAAGLGLFEQIGAAR